MLGHVRTASPASLLGQKLGPLTCTDSLCPETPRAPPNTKTRLNTTTSTDYNAIAMAPIDDAVEDLKSRDSGEHFTLTEIAKKYQVNRFRTKVERRNSVSGGWILKPTSSQPTTRARAYTIYYKADRERPFSHKRDD